jgi:hypothetical protein
VVEDVKVLIEFGKALEEEAALVDKEHAAPGSPTSSSPGFLSSVLSRRTVGIMVPFRSRMRTVWSL